MSCWKGAFLVFKNSNYIPKKVSGWGAIGLEINIAFWIGFIFFGSQIN